MRFGLSSANVVSRRNVRLSLVALWGWGVGHRRYP
jgi:hypothetical protein